MTTKQAVDFFGGVRPLALALECWTTTIYQWGKYPPRTRQKEISRLSNGKLVVEPPKKPCRRCGM